MSTTVYTGCRFPVEDTMESVINKFQKARPGALRLADEILTQQISNVALSKFDLMTMKFIEACKDNHGDSIEMFDSFDALVRACGMATMRRREDPKTWNNSDIDTAAGIVVIPHENRLYGIMRGNNSSMLSYMKDAIGVVDFSWWNNTDQPDHISDSEWDARGLIWDKLLRIESNTQYLGAEVSLVHKNHFTPLITHQDVDFSKVATLGKRAFSLALLTDTARPNQNPFAPINFSHLSLLQEGECATFEQMKARIKRVLVEKPDETLFQKDIHEVMSTTRAQWDAICLNETTQLKVKPTRPRASL